MSNASLQSGAAGSVAANRGGPSPHAAGSSARAVGDLIYILVDFENVQPDAEDMSLIRGEQYCVRVFHGPHQNRFDATMVAALQPLGSQLEYVPCPRKGKNALDFQIAFYMGRLLEQHKARFSGCQRRARFVVISKDGGFDALLEHMRSLGFPAGKAPTIREGLELDSAAALSSNPGRMGWTDSGPPLALEGAGRVPAAAPKPASHAIAPVQAGSEPKIFRSNQPAPADSPHAQKPPAAPPPKKKAVPPRATLEPGDRERVLEHLRTHPKNRPANRDALERHLITVLRGKVALDPVRALIAELERDHVLKISAKKIEYTLPKAAK